MKNLRPFCVVLALTVSLGVSVRSNAAEAEAVHGLAAPSAPSSLMDTFKSIHSDLSKAEFTSGQMLGRIDALVGEIDLQLNNSPSNKADLMKLRSSALQMRARVVRFEANNGSQLIQISVPTASLPVGGQQIMGEQVIELPGAGVGASLPAGLAPMGAPIAGGSFVGGGASMGGIAGGGVAGGAAAGGGLSGGSFGLFAAGAAGLAVAAEDDNDNPGIIASPSN